MTDKESEQIATIAKTWAELSHSGMALMYSSIIERLLGELIEEALPGMNKSLQKALFRAPNAPLSSFSSRINMAAALKIVSTEQAAKLHIIRDIRNSFAHCEIGVHFDHPAIAIKVALLKPYPDQNHYAAYTDNANALISALDGKKRHYAVAKALLSPASE